LGRASESLTASFSNEHPPQFKIENSKFTIPTAFLRPSLRVSSPFGLSEGPSFSDAWRHQYAQLKTQNSQLKTVARPPLLGNAGGVGPSALLGFARSADSYFRLFFGWPFAFRAFSL
jgi:hypothetical protein